MWNVETLNENVDEEISSLPPDMRAKLIKYSEIIEEFGFQHLPRDVVKHLEDKLWELRIKGRDGISRAIYINVFEKRMIILRVFIKKTQKTPKQELEIARQRTKEIK